MCTYLSIFFSSPSRAVPATEASRRGGFKDLLLLAGTGPLSGSLCLQEIQSASQRPHPMVSVLIEWKVDSSFLSPYWYLKTLRAKICFVSS